MTMTPTTSPVTYPGSAVVNLKNQLQSKWNLVFSKNNGSAWISFKPQLGLHVYPCYACRDMFVSKVTFQDHTNRRAILIKYDCKECNQTLNFYNRCSFLLHARSHFSLTEGKIDLSNLEIYNLPFGMMGFLPHPGVDKLFDVEEDIIGDDCYINAQFYSPHVSEKGKQVITLKPNDLLICGAGENSALVQLTLKQISNNIPLCQFITMDCQKKLKQNLLPVETLTRVKEEVPEHFDDLPSSPPPPDENTIQMPVITKIESLSTNDPSYQKCPECKQSQRCSMKMHFIGKNIPLDEKLQCKLCKYVASTKCSYSAHERIHSNIAPFICPECGKKFESREFLMKHLDDVCFHLAKQVRIRCPGKKCGKLFASTTTFSVHFAQHIHTWMQCTVCKECFESIIAFSEHAKIHSNLCFSDKVFKCLGCKNDGSIIYQDNVRQHLDDHTRDRSRYMYVFVCKFCRNYFRSTGTYSAHLLKCQKMQAMIKQGYSYSVDFCVQCHNRVIFYDNENFVACTKCRCINSFNQTTIPSKNIFLQNNELPKVDVCLLCKEEYSSGQEAEHLLKCVYRHPQIVVKKLKHTQNLFSNSDVSNDSSIEYENDESSIKKSSSENDLKGTSIEQRETEHHLKLIRKTSPSIQENLKRKRKRAPLVFRTKKIILSSPPDQVTDLQADEAKPFDGTYYCKMCDFQEINRDQFQLHIISHRDISTDCQCMECGECFVVEPSLIKHLKHYHKIEDTNSYLESNNCYDKNAVEKLKDIMKHAPGDLFKEYQCGLGSQEFSHNQDVKTHPKVREMSLISTLHEE